MPYVILLCGPQGSGKSTLRKNCLSHLACASSDDITERCAKDMQKDYKYVFDNYFNTLVQPLYEQAIRDYQSQGRNFVIDRTHITESSRKRTLRAIEPNYRKFAVYTPAYDISRLMSGISQRVQDGGHDVPEEVVKSFLEKYRTPNYSEGFDMIFSSSGFERVLQFMDFKNE